MDSLTEIKSLGYYAELQAYAIHPRLQPYLRWDFWDPDTDVDDNEVSGPLLGISWRALDHGRIVGHVQRLTTKNPVAAKERTENSLVIEANWMF